MEPFELRGNDVLLAVPTADDIDVLHEVCQDPEIQKWITSIPVPYIRANAEKFVEEIVPASWQATSPTWAIRNPEDRTLLGMVSVSRDAPGFGSVGFWAVPDARGKGVVSGAVRLVAEWAFDPDGLDLDYLQWYAIAGNWASRRVAWATGFRFDGTIRGGHDTRDGRRDRWTATLKRGEPMKPASRWLDVPELRSERIVLRRFEESDADELVEACSDPVSQQWLGRLPSPYTRDDALTFIGQADEHAASGQALHWAAGDPETGSYLGSFSLMQVERLDGGAEIGYLVHPAARGAGVATEAVRLITQYAFDSPGGLGLRRIIIAHADGNTGSRKVILRSGFRHVGFERAAEPLRSGVIVDLHWYDLLSDDVPQRSEVATRHP